MDSRASNEEFITSLLAHDIANYNQTIRGYLEMMLEEQMGAISEEQARVLTICLRQSRRIQGLLDSLHHVTSLAALPIQREPLDLDQAIKTAITRVEEEYADREIRTRFIPSSGRKVLAEPFLETIFAHLLNNAVRHNDSEVVEIDICIDAMPEEDRTWKIQIADNGSGVPPAQKQVIFQRLNQHEVHGSGLGLALVHLLLDRSGGRIWLEESPPERGAVFSLTIPAP